ncbi:MAG: hypothetical protein JJLCMIEE_03435 [Acidimicrobiales bacterium]|nr:hypothetical protein [Acidimicrobiales bacterium]
MKQADDRLLFEAFFALEYRSVVSLGFVLSGSWEAAEDLAQDAFAAAHRDWQRIGCYDKPGAWVRRAVSNRAISLRRKRASEHDIARRLVGTSSPDDQLSPADHELWARVRCLPRRQAQLVALVYLEDRSVKEASDILGISEPTAKTHLQRARRRLAEELEIEEQSEMEQT